MSSLLSIIDCHTVTGAAYALNIPEPERAPSRPEGVSPEAWGHVLQAGAARRHTSRVAFILNLLSEAIWVHPDGEVPSGSPPTVTAEGVTFTRYQAAVAAAVLRLDHAGIGGAGGVGRDAGGFASARIPLLNCLPRHQQQTGGVWDGAVQSAISALEIALGERFQVGTGFEVENADQSTVFTPPAAVIAACTPWFRAAAIRALRNLATPEVRDSMGAEEWERSLRLWSSDLDELEGRGDTIAARLSHEFPRDMPEEPVRLGAWVISPAWVVLGATAWCRELLDGGTRPRWTLQTDGLWWDQDCEVRRAHGGNGLPGELIEPD